MSVPEIAQFKGGSVDSPLTKEGGLKIAEYREGGSGGRHGGSDSGFSWLPSPATHGWATAPAPCSHPGGVAAPSCRPSLCSRSGCPLMQKALLASLFLLPTLTDAP